MSRESLEERIICTGIISARDICPYVALEKQNHVAEVGDEEHVKPKATSMDGNIWHYREDERCSQGDAVAGQEGGYSPYQTHKLLKRLSNYCPV